MPLDASRQQKVTEWLANKRAAAPCGCCGRNVGYHVVDSLASCPTTDANGKLDGGAWYAVVIVCNQCGAATMLSAAAIGIAPPNPPPRP